MKVGLKRKKLKEEVDRVQDTITVKNGDMVEWDINKIEDPLGLYNSCLSLLLWGHFLTEEDKEYIQMVTSWLEDHFNYHLQDKGL